MSMQEVQKKVLKKIANIDSLPKSGAFNVRVDGKSIGRESSENIKIELREDGKGLSIHIAPNTKGEKVYIPVVISETGLKDLVYNDFYIGKNAQVEIIAGCGIHNCGAEDSQHDGIHSFYLEEDSHVTYVENHYGEGAGQGARILNPITNIYMKKGSQLEMETYQIKGVDHTIRETNAELDGDTILIVNEKLMTHQKQYAETAFNVELNGEKSSAHVVSRSVAKDHSKQLFISRVNGRNDCVGHTECDAIIMDSGSVRAVPEVTAYHPDASLIHEATIGKIAGDQLIKLTTLGLDEKEAEEAIVNGFLR